MGQTTYGYQLGGQILVVTFDLLDVRSSQFGMIAIAACGSYHALNM